jgi:hypothetical protein
LSTMKRGNLVWKLAFGILEKAHLQKVSELCTRPCAASAERHWPDIHKSCPIYYVCKAYRGYSVC